MRKDITVKQIVRKLKREAGFTFTETLVAVVILVMVSATALPAAMNAYRNAVDAANAQVLLSTTVNALRDELSTAWDVQTSDGTTITYKSADTGDKSVITIQDKTIMLQEYAPEEGIHWLPEGERKTTEIRPLVSAAMRQTTRNGSDHMHVTYTGAVYANGYVTITGLAVERDEGVKIAKMPETGLLIRVMSGVEPVSGGDGT